MVTAAPAPKSKSISQGEAPLVVERGQARRLFIVGFAGQVNVIPMPMGNQVTVRALKYMDKEDSKTQGADALDQLVIRSSNLGDTVEVRAQLPPNGTDWVRWAQGKHVPQVRLDITAPQNMNLEIYWTHGDVHVPRWTAPVAVTSQDGHLDVENVDGNVTIRSMSGTVKVEKITGNVNMENFSSAITAEDITGKTKIRNFSGEAHVKNVTGPVYLSSQKGPVTLQDTKGTLEVQTGMAVIHVLEHDGSLTGHSDAGAINAKLIGDTAEARLTSVSGSLSLTVPKGSRASVSLFTTEGHLTAPSSLEQKNETAGRWARGNLNGGETGRIRLRSDSGDLVLRSL